MNKLTAADLISAILQLDPNRTYNYVSGLSALRIIQVNLFVT